MANAVLDRELGRCKLELGRKKAALEDLALENGNLRQRCEALNNENNNLETQNEAACDAKSIMEIGLIRGRPLRVIIQDCHRKLKEVTPELIEEDSDDEEAIPIINLQHIGLTDAATQTEG